MKAIEGLIIQINEGAILPIQLSFWIMADDGKFFEQEQIVGKLIIDQYPPRTRGRRWKIARVVFPTKPLSLTKKQFDSLHAYVEGMIQNGFLATPAGRLIRMGPNGIVGHEKLPG